MSQLDELTAFTLEHYPISQLWKSGTVRNWLAWASSKNFLIVARDEDKVVGLAIARPLSHVDEHTKSSDECDEDGDNIFIDLAIADSKPVQQAIGFGIVSRFGANRKTVAFFRNGNLKRHAYQGARKALFKKRTK